MTLADLIAPGSSKITLHFPDEGQSGSLGQIWAEGLAFSGWYQEYGRGPLAVALSNSRACVSVLIGAVATGATLISIPPPPRGADLEWYGRFVARQCASAGCSTLAMEHSLTSTLPAPEGLQLASFQAILGRRRSVHLEPQEFRLIQFTSGSTGESKGIPLDQKMLATNVAAILEWLQPGPGDAPCSWLPLSHDMGLIGMFFAALAGAGDGWCDGADVVLLTPEGFLRNPTRWLEAISHYRATITSSPPFGLEMACRRQISTNVDLSHMRICIVGGEPIRVEPLDRFANALYHVGFRRRSLCPAYGLAECTLAVTGSSPHSEYRSLALAGAIAEAGSQISVGETSLVSSGLPLKDVEVRVETRDDQIGEIMVRGPSVAKSYSDGQILTDSTGWLRTRDLGFFQDGEVFVIGRGVDIIDVAGRNIYAVDVESLVGELDAIRSGRVTAFSGLDGNLTIAAEPESRLQKLDPDEVRQMCNEIRHRVRDRLGVSPRRVAIVKRGKLPLTSSGKVRRVATAEALTDQVIEPMNGSLGL